MNRFPQILQLDRSGTPQTWITYELSAYHYAKGTVLYSLGEMDFDLHGGTNAKTGKQSIMTINTIIALNGIPSKKAMQHYQRVPLTNKTLFRRDQNMCGYCGRICNKDVLSRDHIIPRSKGGRNTWENVVTACSRCNKAKDNRTPKEWGTDLIYVPYKPDRAEWLVLRNHKIVADQMEFLKNMIRNPESRLLS